MSPSIEIDEQVLRVLKAHAEPFVDTPNSVLRRLLEIPGRDETKASAPTAASSESTPRNPSRRRSVRSRSRRQGRTRVPSSSLLPEAEYELPILQALTDRGGRAASREVVEEVGRRLEPQLKPKDLETLDSGDVRWENRVHFTRLRLVKLGLIRRGSPRGVWEISDDGLALVRARVASEI